MSKVMWLIGRNLPLGHHAQYSAEMAGSRTVWGGSFDTGNYSSQKKLERIARTIVNGLSQPDVVDLVAREWDQFSSQVRIQVTSFANGHNHSGNVTKGIIQLDRKLGGKITSKGFVHSERVMRTGTDGKLFADRRTINRAAAMAQAAHAIVAKPANYDTMSASQKRKVTQDMANARRQHKN